MTGRVGPDVVNFAITQSDNRIFGCVVQNLAHGTTLS
jgi:hypothetical protein